MGYGRLHHVTVMSRDLERTIAFYARALRLGPLDRPPFPNAGAWLANGDLVVHVNHNPAGTFRRSAAIDGDDVHFAVRVDDFEATVAALRAGGFRETDDETVPLRMHVRRSGAAGFPQLFIIDPDNNLIEINAAG